MAVGGWPLDADVGDNGRDDHGVGEDGTNSDDKDSDSDDDGDGVMAGLTRFRLMAVGLTPSCLTPVTSLCQRYSA